jgi:hypothetical protein
VEKLIGHVNGNTKMLTRRDLADFSRAHENDMVLSVYLAREGSDPGNRGAWRLRLAGALGSLRDCVEHEAPADLPVFDHASEQVAARLVDFGRVLPHEGWSAFATGDRLWHAEGLPFPPAELVRWRQGIYAAPYVRALKTARPVILALLDHWRAHIYEYQEGALSAEAVELATDPRADVDADDIGMSKRASTTSGRGGETRTDYAQHLLERNAKALRKQVVGALLERAGDAAGVVLGGTGKAIKAARKDLEDKLAGRMVEKPELSFDSTHEELSEVVGRAASELTQTRQARLLETCCASGAKGSMGWNQTYRALAAGAVDTLLLARALIESCPDDAERLVRLALAQGADVEELGEELGDKLFAEADGVAARLRYRMLG